MPRVRKRNQDSPRPSKDQVRAWLSTVIAPIVSALIVEEERLGRENWSFRCSSQDFEFLWPVQKMVAVSYAPNLGQLLRYRSDVATWVRHHDESLLRLRESARIAYERVRNSDRFIALVAERPQLREVDIPYIAEYIVNGIRELDSFYVHHDMWVRDGGEFLRLRELPQLVEHFEALRSRGRAFAKVVAAFRASTLSLQVDLADKYKLPPVEPVEIARS